MPLNPLRTLLAAAAAGFMALAAPIATAEEFTPEQKAAVESIVRDYIMANPEIIQDALVAMEQKRQDAENEARKATISSVSDLLYNSKRQVVLGDPNAPITLVEFFDYNCGYCKRALDDTMALLEEKDVRIVLKEMPILGPGSVEAARVGIAVHLVAPERYIDFHHALLSVKGQADEASAMQVVNDLGLDEAAVRKAMTDPEVANTIEEVYSLANRLGLTGTPTYVIGDEVVFGAVGADELKTRVMAMRECGQATC